MERMALWNVRRRHTHTIQSLNCVVESMNIKSAMAIMSLLFGMAIGLIGVMLPPQGEIDGSLLCFIGQLLIFSGSCIGIDVYVSGIVSNAHKERRRQYDEQRDEKQVVGGD